MDTRKREGKPALLGKSITCFSYIEGGGLLATFSPVGGLFVCFGAFLLFFSSLRYIGDMKSYILSLLRGAFLFVWGAFALPPTTKISAGKHMRPPPPLPHYLNILYNIMLCCLLKPILAIVRGAK